MSKPALTDAQFKILATLSKGPATKAPGRPYPEGIDGRAFWALQKHGLVETPARGVFAITAKGRAAYAVAFGRAKWAERKATK